MFFTHFQPQNLTDSVDPIFLPHRPGFCPKPECASDRRSDEWIVSVFQTRACGIAIEDVLDAPVERDVQATKVEFNRCEQIVLHEAADATAEVGAPELCDSTGIDQRTRIPVITAVIVDTADIIHIVCQGDRFETERGESVAAPFRDRPGVAAVIGPAGCLVTVIELQSVELECVELVFEHISRVRAEIEYNVTEIPLIVQREIQTAGRHIGPIDRLRANPGDISSNGHPLGALTALERDILSERA